MPQLKYNLDDIQTFMFEPGTYKARLVKVEQTLSKKKKPMLVWHWKLLSGPQKGQIIRSFTSLLDNALSNLKEHVSAFGFQGRINVNTSKLVGKSAKLVIGLTSNESGRESSNVIGVQPLKSKAEDEPEDDEDVDDEDADDEEDEDTDADDDDDDEELDEDEDDEDEDDDDDDDEEDEEPVRTRKKKPVAKSSKKPLKKGRGKLPF